MRSVFACFLAASAVTAAAQTPATPKAQVPADEKAFKSARATEDPGKRLAAFQQLLRDYPKTNYRLGAQFGILDTLIKDFPDREAEIDAEARQLQKQWKRVGGKQFMKGQLADKLASDGPKPVDLPQAEKWARDDADHTAKVTEARFDKEEQKSAKKYKQPPPTAEAMRADYNGQQAGAMLPLANVLLRKGDLPGSAQLLDRAYALDPTNDDTSRLKGELALARHNNGEALADFERTMVLGDLKPPLRTKMAALYRNAHNGSDAGLEADLDAEYAKLNPPPSPAAKQPPANGHTVLLELFTGSACGPCVGGDVAVETVLAAYGRTEVVALAFDQHIPEPDPLANEDSLARANGYDAHSTPNYFLDGAKLPFYGGGRTYAGELYGKISKAIDTEAARPSGVRLALQAQPGQSGVVAATASVTMPTMLDPAPPPPPAADAKAPAKPAPKPKPPQLALHFALVEDEVRYSGENGVRFHRMVVRSLSVAQPLALGQTKDLHASFDPAAVSAKLHTYLTDYQTHNDRFSKVEFLAMPTALNPQHLAVAAWVEDTANHRVLQAAFQPLVAAEPTISANASR